VRKIETPRLFRYSGRFTGMVSRRPLAIALVLASAGCATGGAAGGGTLARDAHDTGAEGSTPPPKHDGRATRRTLGWVVLSVGGEAAVAAIVTSIMLVHDKSILDSQCNAQKLCTENGADAAGAISSLKPWNTGTWIAGIVGVGAGAALLFTSQPDKPASTAITLSPEGSGAGLGLRSQF
jgi:hypothetical protein